METGAGFPKPAPYLLSLIGEIYSLALLGAYGNRLFHWAVLFVPSLNYIGPRRQSLYCKRSVGSRHSEERVPHHADIRAHPGVHVALYRNHDFLAGEALRHRGLPRRLRLVPV